MAAKKKVTQAATDELVKRYIIDKVKAHAGPDRDLFESVLALHELAEQHESGTDSSKRLGELRDSPMVRTAMAVLGPRFQRLADIGVRIATDTQALRVDLRKSLEAVGIDPADPKQAAEAEAEYERVLAATIALPVAIDNVNGLADMVDLANDVLNQQGLKRHAYEAAWQVGRRIIFKDPKVLARMEQVKSELQGDKARLERIAKLIRKLGPGIVKDAYARAGKARTAREAQTKASAAPQAKASAKASAKAGPKPAAKNKSSRS